MTGLTDENGHTTYYTYDVNDNLLTATDPLGHTTLYTYEATYNKVTSVQNAKDHTTTFEYDTNGNNTIDLTQEWDGSELVHVKRSFRGIDSVLFQHETDHLKGITIFYKQGVK